MLSRVQDAASAQDQLSPPEQHILRALRDCGGVALVNQPVGGEPRIRIGAAEFTRGCLPPVEELIAALHALARRRLVQRAGGSPCAEVFRLSAEGRERARGR